MEQIRWKQRFNNLEKAFKKLERGLEIFNYDEFLAKREELKKSLDINHKNGIIIQLEELDLEREGIIQRFEYSFELFISTLKDLLEYFGEPNENLRGSRTILGNALQKNLIEDQDAWRKMVISRNKTSHTYDEATADEVTENIIKLYLPIMKKLYAVLKKEYEK